MQAWPGRVHEKIRRSCQESFELFSKQVSPQHPDTPSLPPSARSKRYMLNIEDQQFMEMIASPVINPAGQVVQVVAVYGMRRELADCSRRLMRSIARGASW